MESRAERASQSAARLDDLVDRVSTERAPVVVERDGKPVAAVIAYDDYLAIRDELDAHLARRRQAGAVGPIKLADLPLDEIAVLCRRYAVRELSLFGSALRVDFRPDSDLDLLIEFEPEAEVGLLTLARIQHQLEQLVKREVDLVPKRGLKPLIRDQVLSEAQVLYAA
jgi:prevent-host-death family protein